MLIAARVTAGARVFFVRDNGVGFNRTQAAQLCTPFHRLHATAEYVGTGVGLAIVARVIEQHPGRIRTEARA